MLRGPQTLGEIRNNAHRLYDFDDLEDVQYMLQRLADHDPPLVMTLPRQPGQKEARFAHLLCGEPEIPEGNAWVSPGGADNALAARVDSLEAEVVNLRQELENLKKKV